MLIVSASGSIDRSANRSHSTSTAFGSSWTLTNSIMERTHHKSAALPCGGQQLHRILFYRNQEKFFKPWNGKHCYFAITQAVKLSRPVSPRHSKPQATGFTPKLSIQYWPQ